ncbi:MAG: glycosyltransferase [Paludibacteraceae bacterium]|nr:glycosyltransferase [Paludibacteraceae bacterium]
MIMNEMLVSVIIPAYNTEKYIARCLDSVCGQTYKNLEIIVVNDGSKDNTSSIIASYAERDKRIIFINLTENIGNGKGRNLAIKKTKGEYICFVDSDDFITPDMIQCLVDKVRSTSYPEVVIYGHQEVQEKDDKLKILGDPILPRLSGKESIEQLQTCFFFGYKNIGLQPWIYFVKRQYIFDNEIFFDESGHSFEDVIFATKLIFSVNHIEQVEHPFYSYIIRKGSIMSSRSKKRIESWIYVTQELKKFLKEKNLFEKYKDAYTIFFVNCAFLVPFFDYTEMKEKDNEIEKFLIDMSQTNVIQSFYRTEFKIPHVDGLTKAEQYLIKKIKKSTLMVSSHIKFAMIMFRLSYKVRKIIRKE